MAFPWHNLFWDYVFNYIIIDIKYWKKIKSSIQIPLSIIGQYRAQAGCAVFGKLFLFISKMSLIMQTEAKQMTHFWRENVAQQKRQTSNYREKTNK